MIDDGYKCKGCGKIYRKNKYALPAYCKKCGAELIDERYGYNLIANPRNRRMTMETRETNMFGGYDYIKAVTTKMALPIRVKRKWFGWVELKKENIQICE